MRLWIRFASVLFVAGALIVGCGLIPDNQGNFEPTGTAFTLNPQISVTQMVGSRTGYDPTGMFSIDFSGHSTGEGDASDVLPAGLFLSSTKSKVQHMLLVQDHPITVPPTQDTTITIGTYCCNESRAVPNDTDRYTIGPITDNADLQTIVGITKHKLLDVSNVNVVQNAVWSVTDGSGLTQSMIDSLNALPAESTGLARPHIQTVEPGFFRLQKERARRTPTAYR